MSEGGKTERFLAGFLILAIAGLIWYFFIDPQKATPYLVAALVAAGIFIFSRKRLYKKNHKI